MPHMQQRVKLVRAFETAKIAYLADKSPANEERMIQVFKAMMRDDPRFITIAALFTPHVLNTPHLRQKLLNIILSE